MNEPIIRSLLDNDIYKFSTTAFILDLYPETKVKYTFTNRGTQRFTQEFVDALKNEINESFPKLTITDEELEWFRKTCPYLKVWFFDVLKNYRFDPKEVVVELLEDGNLKLEIEGLWWRTSLWEVPLMATISELYFKIIDKNWNMDDQYKIAYDKAKKLQNAGVRYADFGTRRRRSFETQDLFVETQTSFGLPAGAQIFRKIHEDNNDFSFPHYQGQFPQCWDIIKSGEKKTFVGTSNVFLAYKYDTKPIGSIPHEIIMGLSVLEGLRNANYFAMDKWQKCFNQSLGTMLTDTYGVDAFLNNFNTRFAKSFDSVRHDSGNPFLFGEKIIAHYEKLGIDPTSKTIIFSDNLDVEKAIKINDYFLGRVKCSFGIGTNFTNDFYNSPALNMVIKLSEADGFPVVKISDSPGKESGDAMAIQYAKWVISKSVRNL